MTPEDRIRKRYSELRPTGAGSTEEAARQYAWFRACMEEWEREKAGPHRCQCGRQVYVDRFESIEDCKGRHYLDKPCELKPSEGNEG